MGALYVGFGVMAALLQGGLPPILRARGLGMDQIAWIFALYLPLGLSFLWAPQLDRIRLPFLSHRVGWIVAAQLFAVAGVMAVALLETAAIAILFGLGLAVAVAIATMDLALDALAVEVSNEQLRPQAAALKLAALASGAILGGGVFVGLLDYLGWQSTFLLLAALLLATTLPVLRLPQEAIMHAPQRSESGYTLWHALQQADLRRGLLLLMVTVGAIYPLSALNRVMLVDLGVSLERIAWIVGTLQPLGQLLVSLIAAPLIRQLGCRKALLLFTALGLACVLLLAYGYHHKIQDLAIVATIGMASIVGGVMVVYAALMLSWSAGDQVATRYAVLFCGSRLAGIITTVLAGQIVSQLGWLVFYGAGAIVTTLATLWLLSRLEPRTSKPVPKLESSRYQMDVSP